MEILRGTDPFVLFEEWLEAARAAEPNDPEAMALATVDADGMPSVRMVLLKEVAAGGFRFFTNMESRKAEALRANPRAALCFHWKSLLRQVRVEGVVTPVDAATADAYFATRHPQSRRGAWASRQSQPLESRAALLAAAEACRERFGDDVPRPPHWSGFHLAPQKIEFWQQGDNRLHDRFLFTAGAGGWNMTRLYP